MENATAADSSQSNISRIYIWKDKATPHQVNQNHELSTKTLEDSHYIFLLILLFTMENATAADNTQSNISRIYIWKDKTAKIIPLRTKQQLLQYFMLSSD